MNLINNARRSEVENAGAAVKSGEDRVVVKEVDLEELETSGCAF